MSSEFGFECAGSGSGVIPTAPFVLLLQEVYRYSDHLPLVLSGKTIPWPIDPNERSGEDLDIVEVAERCGLALVYVPSARNGGDDRQRPHEDKGNAILSTLPLTNPLALDLPFEGGRKVAVAATVHTPGGDRLRFASLHLDVASTLVRTLLTGNQTRARQAQGLIEALDRAERDGPEVAATTVGADLNTWAYRETTVRLMRLAFPQSPPWDGEGTRSGFPVDHIFFRTSRGPDIAIERYERLEDRHYSDHHPRRLTIRYRPDDSNR